MKDRLYFGIKIAKGVEQFWQRFMNNHGCFGF